MSVHLSDCKTGKKQNNNKTSQFSCLKVTSSGILCLTNSPSKHTTNNTIFLGCFVSYSP